jgi:hypothetical protein
MVITGVHLLFFYLRVSFTLVLLLVSFIHTTRESRVIFINSYVRSFYY